MHWALEEETGGDLISEQAVSMETCLTLELGDCIFALDVKPVREILDPQSVTPVPGAPSLVLGSFDWRGEVVMVLSGRQLVGLPGQETERPDDRRFVVVELDRNEELTSPLGPDVSQDGQETQIFALSVDCVRRVNDFASDAFNKPPGQGSGLYADAILGVALVEGETIQRLDIARTLTSSGLGVF